MFRHSGRNAKDGLYKSLNYQLYIDKRKTETPPPPLTQFSCKRKIATNRSVESERERNPFLSFRTFKIDCARTFDIVSVLINNIQITYTIKEGKRREWKVKKKDTKR